MLIVLGCSLARAFQMILAFPALNFGDVAAFKQTADVVIAEQHDRDTVFFCDSFRAGAADNIVMVINQNVSNSRGSIFLLFLS